MEKVTKIKRTKGRGWSVKLAKYMVRPKTHYHTYTMYIYTIEWEMTMIITEFKKERYVILKDEPHLVSEDERHVVSLVRNMSFCETRTHVGEESIEDALNIMWKDRLGVTFYA